jgi:hypothetical protein
MKFVLAFISFGLSALLFVYLIAAMVALVTIEGLGAVPHEVIYTWPNNIIFGSSAVLCVVFLCGGVSILGSRSSKS